MDSETLARVERVVGRTASVVTRVVGGGYTAAERWIVGFDGGSAFVKIATTPLTARFLRQERAAFGQLRGDWLPEVIGFDDHPERPLLVLEDLSHGHWPPPWDPRQVARVREVLARKAATRFPGLPALDPSSLAGWSLVAEDPGPFLSIGLCSRAWLDRCLPALVEAERRTDLTGDDLLHNDVRSDNLCLLPDRVVLVDWNGACRGPAALDEACWAPSLRLEGGPLPDEARPEVTAFAPVVAGYFAARAGLPSIPDAPRVRWIQLRQLRIALPWACRVLGLPGPDLRWAQRILDALDPEDPHWHAAMEEVLVDAYLATDDPRAGSGKSGDETDWRWSRELVLDAVVGERATILDVGCANGYLMESLERWGAERGLQIEAHGLEISDRLARVARHCLPHAAARIATGNVLDWAPPRRFDLVHTGLDYVPHPRRRELVDRILRDLLLPGGRLVLRAERIGPTDPVEQLNAIGLEPDGVLEAVHPTTGVVRRTAWLARADG